MGAGCAETGEDPPPVGGADTGVAVIDSGASDAMVRECDITAEGSKRACSCPGMPDGTQACLGGKYTTCQCGPIDAGGPAGTLCKGGFYSGDFEGKFKPSVFGLFGFFESFIEVDVTGVANGDRPALSLTLQEQESGGGEFRTFSVENGCLIGNAKAVGTDNPFVARLNGALNCQTGVFEGTIAGNYNLVSSGGLFVFQGPVSAQFRVPQNQLVDGVWNVKEGDALLGGASGGGGGTWKADWESDTSPSNGPDPCAVLDSMFDGGSPSTPDAGSTGTSDAGTDAGRGDASP